MEDILNGKHICHGTLGCPFTNYWIKKGIELEKAGYEQGKKDQQDLDVKLACDSDTSLIKIVSNKIRKQTLEESLLLRDAEKKALAKRIYEEVLKDAKESLFHEYGEALFFERLEQKLKAME
jgi:hypothetical protein